MFTFFWLIVILVSLILQRKYIAEAYRDSFFRMRMLRPRHFIIGLLSITSVIIPSLLLYYYVPFLRFGWLFTMTGSGEPLPSNLMGTMMSIAMLVMLIIVFLLIPQLAYIEEHIFRRPILHSGWVKVLLVNILFGLVHIIMGIPLSAAISLTFAGLIFYIVMKLSYIREPEDELALTQAGLVHAAHNMMLFIVIFCLQVIIIYNNVMQLFSV